MTTSSFWPLVVLRPGSRCGRILILTVVAQDKRGGGASLFERSSGMEEACRLWAEVDGRERCKRILRFKRLFGEVVSAKKFARMVKEIELKAWVYNLMLGLTPAPALALSAAEG